VGGSFQRSPGAAPGDPTGRARRDGQSHLAERTPDLRLATGASHPRSAPAPRTDAAHGAAPGSREQIPDDWIFAGSRSIPDAIPSASPDAAAAPGAPVGSAQTDSLFRVPSADHVAEGLGTRDEIQPGRGRSAARPVASFGSLRLLGQLRASYLLAEAEEGLLVVDQHAAHERVLYERLRSSWLASGVARQGLLTPVTVSLPPRAVAALEEEAEVVARLGFEVETFGEGVVLVRAIPAEMTGQDAAVLVGELAAALEEVERGGLSDEGATRWLPGLDRLFATLACHSARRFGDRLPEAEQRAILEGLDAIPWAPTCPHGRPVAILLHAEDLERRFRRS
jgi:DNA mismatch repair protein MutL